MKDEIIFEGLGKDCIMLFKYYTRIIGRIKECDVATMPDKETVTNSVSLYIYLSLLLSYSLSLT